jgi:dihydrofolate reductase
MITRPKFNVFIAISLDGYIAGSNDELDWLESERMIIEGEDFGYKKFSSQMDVILMGKNTYLKVLEFPEWPYKDKRLIVYSTSLTNATQAGVEIFSGDVQELIDKFNNEQVKNVYVDGGITISNLLNMNLIDIMTISVIPIILGSGKKLFHDIEAAHNLKLESTKAYPNGLVQLVYSNEKAS